MQYKVPCGACGLLAIYYLPGQYTIYQDNILGHSCLHNKMIHYKDVHHWLVLG